MAINPITNTENTKSHHIPYKDATGQVHTENNVKPLPPQGHLVHDTFLSVPKFFIKDIAYDIKSVKDGFKGTANDHQTGRLNDVGMKLGGIGIATMLAARTKSPMIRIMEYLGLGVFLTSMSLFPKIAINAPSRLIQGFNIGKEYIDDQGRKKSVFQDSNYIPFDMYRGEYPGEDLEIIGDRIGISRNIKNRDELIKEQMRKVATQNNTLWMLTAGFATPVMTALICCGLEKVIAPVVEQSRNAINNSRITKILHKTQTMKPEVGEVKPNSLSKNVNRILVSYRGKELAQTDYDNIVKLLTKNMDENASEGIREDLAKILKPELSAEVNKNSADEILKSIKEGLPSRNKSQLEKVFIPAKEDLAEILNKSDITEIRDGLKKFFDARIAKEAADQREALTMHRNNVIEDIVKNVNKNKICIIDDAKIKEVGDFAKILGDFKINDSILKKCKSTKFEYAPETVLARSYTKFENALLDVLDIKYKDLKQMMESEQFTKEILDKKLEELVKDKPRFEKAVEKLTKIMAEQDVKLNGNMENGSHIKDLITAIENNYNVTAQRLSKAGNFKNTIDKMVKQDVNDLSNSLKSREDLFKLLDSTLTPNKELKGIDKVKSEAKGVGSSKNQTISRIVERYQGAENSYRRILHLLDFYKNFQDTTCSNYDKELIRRGKDVLLGATSADHTMKLSTGSNAELYKDLILKVWDEGKVSEEMQNALKKHESMTEGNLKKRFESYIKRFKDIIGNNNLDFTKPDHTIDMGALNNYTKPSKTRMSKFNLVSQTSIEVVQNAAKRRYGNQKWARLASIICGSVLGGTILAQFCFGKIKNPHNIEKKVSDNVSK